jgi:hypothetical protein
MHFERLRLGPATPKGQTLYTIPTHDGNYTTDPAIALLLLLNKRSPSLVPGNFDRWIKYAIRSSMLNFGL